jgi:hypothetical protein
MIVKKVEIKTFFNKEIIQSDIIFDDGELIKTTSSEIIKLKEQGIKDALIELGWTPPKNKD